MRRGNVKPLHTEESHTLDSPPTAHISLVERLNFLLTNRLPRRWLTLFMGRFSKIRNPVVRTLSIGLWRLFVDDLRLFEAKKRSFDSLHDCFVRELRDDARPIDAEPGTLVSPCDAVIGEYGRVRDGTVLQAKGYAYSVAELIGSEQEALALEGSRYVTLRLKSSMYHHFHAPADGRIDGVRYISGDTWNVNPVALKVVEKLFCRNERAVIRIADDEATITLVPVAAILVASMRIRGLDEPLNLEYDGPNEIALRRRVRRGDSLGHFEHGSTIIVFVDDHYRLNAGLESGDTIRMGRSLFRRSRNISEK